MRNSALWQVSVTTSGEAEEAVAELFQTIFNCPPSVYIDAATRAVTISTYCEQTQCKMLPYRTALRAGLRSIHACGLDTGTGRVQARRIRREDWAESWKRHFKPQEIGRALLIKPSWSRRKPRPNQAVVVLDPGLSFGTGQHPTTSFCLEQLVRSRQQGETQSFLDLGTGSGILAIAGASIGYHPVNAFDFDLAAVRIAKGNATRNGVADRVRVVGRDLTRLAFHSREKFDVVCANLTADLLVNQRRRILNRLAPGGVVILAGILRSQFGNVRKAYASEGMKLVSSRIGGEWRSGAFQEC